MYRRAAPLALSSIALAGAVACGGAPRATAPVSAAPRVTAPAKTAAAAPVARPTLELGDVTVRAAPILVTYSPNPDVAGVIAPRVSPDERRSWSAYASARRKAGLEALGAVRVPERPTSLCGDGGDGGTRPARPEPGFVGASTRSASEPAVDAARATHVASAADLRGVSAARANLVRALQRGMAARPVTPAAIASRALLAYLEESTGGEETAATGAESDASHGRERAAALYREVKEAAPMDTPVGYLARLRLAALAGPVAAAEEYDALLAMPLASAEGRAWARGLSGRPLGDWSRAAGVLRAVTLSDASPAERAAARTEWLVATANAGSPREVIALSMNLIREPAHPHVALDVAALAVVRVGEVGEAREVGDARLASALPPPAFATLMHHVASMALDDRDLVLATDAASAVLARAPSSAEAPASAWVRAACMALRGERAAAEAQIAAAREAYVASAAWGEALRAHRDLSGGFPTDAQIAALAGTLDAPLPSPPEGDDARRAAIEIRTRALGRRCFADAPLVARGGALEARVELTVEAYDGSPARARARPVPLDDGGEPEPRMARALAAGMACVTRTAPRLFADAPGGVHATLRIVADGAPSVSVDAATSAVP